MRIAVVHHWFVTRGGGERVAECLASLLPSAELFTLLAHPASLPESLQSRPLHTSLLDHVPFARSHHRHLLPFYPAATESLDLRGFDLVVSSDSGPVKGVRLSPDAIHICYCHSPMRYLYDGYASYRAQMGPATRWAFSACAGRVRRWDQTAARRVTHFLANSRYVADRIRRAYGRESTVIHPPIDLHLARQASVVGSHYLAAGRLVPYKRTDLMIEACQRLGRELRIVGAGPEMGRLQRLSARPPAGSPGAPIHLLGELPTEQLWDQYAAARALLFAADEDFGMVPLEAQACGRPVLAYGVGGSLETVRGTGLAPTGLWFAEQTAESLMEAIQRFEAEASRFQPEAALAWAEGFRTERFLAAVREFLLRHVPGVGASLAPSSAAATPA